LVWIFNMMCFIKVFFNKFTRQLMFYFVYLVTFLMIYLFMLSFFNKIFIVLNGIMS
jgi:hypothetical protein